MNLSAYLALAGAITLELIGTALLQASEHFTRPLYGIISVLSFILAIFLLSVALKTIPVGIAYATLSGIGIAIIAAIGFVIFKQKLDTPALVGITFIAIGSVLIGGFSQSSSN